jgi:hypothetical protein
MFADLAKFKHLSCIILLSEVKLLGEGKTMNKIHLMVEDLPELETEVAISGSVKQQEVGGAICLSVAAGIALYFGTS